MKLRVVVPGAGFGGLELSSILSEEMGDHPDLALIDKNDSFFFGFSKFAVMFGYKTPEAVRIYYSNIVKPGVHVVRDTVTAIAPGVYAIGDVCSVGRPKAGVFAEGAAKVAAASIIAEFKSGEQPAPYNGIGTCYIEFGDGRVGKANVDFFSGARPTGTFTEASIEIVADKEHFGSSRIARWFGIEE